MLVQLKFFSTVYQETTKIGYLGNMYNYPSNLPKFRYSISSFLAH